MEEILSPSPPLSESSNSFVSDDSPLGLITSLEQHVMSNMDTLVDHLQSLHQAGTLDKDTLKAEFNRISRLSQAVLAIRLLPSLLNPSSDKGDEVEATDLFKKIHQAVEVLQVVFKDQILQAIDQKEAEVLKQIQARDQQIRHQIAQKQQAISQIVRAKTQNPRLG
jgi:TRAP-type mannitol/chloroaromatic compound transport system substrate-binding protein